MEVDFNGLRRNLANDYNNLINDLNQNIGPLGLVEIEKEKLQKPIDDLRSMIGVLLALCDPEDEIKDISNEINLKRLGE